MVHDDLDYRLNSDKVRKKFWKYVEKTDTCWNWTGSIAGKSDYGRLTVQSTDKTRTRTVAAHRYSWELHTKQAIPDGIQVDHICHNTLCVRPDHLRLATVKQNNENQRGPQRNSKSGIRGVCRDMGLWRATVGHEGKIVRVGRYKTMEEAEAAVVAKRLELFTHNDADRNSPVNSP